MCGIFGLVISPAAKLDANALQDVIRSLFELSESRGSEAAGIAVALADGLRMYRRALPAGQMLRSEPYREFIRETLSADNLRQGLAIIGHSRLVTNGSQGMEENNQPVRSSQCIGVHNGIVVNDAALWEANSDLTRRSAVDSEVIFQLIDKHYANAGQNLAGAITETYKSLQGEANIAFVHATERVLSLATNVGSLYTMNTPELGMFSFASEGHFLREHSRLPVFQSSAPSPIKHLSPMKALIVAIDDLALHPFDLEAQVPDSPFSRKGVQREISDRSPKRKALIRCTRCILPHTFPFIHFDSNGVCNYCLEAPAPRTDNRQTLETKLEKFRSRDGSPDCIVALSGGRDSCYGLHVVKKELGLNPIAYTYDWAMVTDEARRNSARVCGELGVEHIIRSADILSKRRNIRMNIDAWLHRPDLGMIPLFMAGDKQFFHYATQVSRQTGVPLVIFCGGNNLEITRFKTGFCGVQDRSTNTMVGLDLAGKIKLLAYYAKNVLLNPRYLNRSVFDTLFAFYSTYVSRQEFLYLYRYVDWNEKQIAETLSKHYGWESASDSASTWRIGDGTAAFYNFIYHTVAGFSEHDTFRSNQIRAGLLSREAALSQVEAENKPRYAAMQDYANLVGFSLDEALVVINNIPKIV